LIAGLGNPGPAYECTRHNVGFLALEAFLTENGPIEWERTAGVRYTHIEVGVHSLLCVEPQKFMNQSGPPVQALAASCGVDPASILIVHDDLDLELGRLKLKRDGGTAGHRGLESLVEALGTDQFPRLRLGIGRPPEGISIIDFVLAPFKAAEGADLDALLDRSVDAIGSWIETGTESAMNLVNPRRKRLEPGPADC
jgi:PTH1 family peptidyl-tRNA hydrolase